MDIEKAINREVRFQWEETASAWGGGRKMATGETFDAVAEDINDQETIDYINQEIRSRFNQACDRYQDFLDSLGEKY